MTRLYTPQTIIALPRLSASYAYVLLAQLLTAATTQQQQLEASGKELPDFLARPLSRLTTAAQALASALQLAPPSDSAAARDADAIFDGAWGGLNQFLSACLKLQAGLNPDPAGTQALFDLLFPEGTAFLADKYLAEWQASQARLDTLADPASQSYLDTLTVLGGQLQLTNVQQAHAALGAALGITTVLPAAPSAQLRTALDQALSSLKVYVCKVVAWPDPEEAGSQELTDALIEPLASWEDYQTSSASTAAASPDGDSSADPETADRV